MKRQIIRLIKLILGLFLFAVGIVMTLNANLGVAPWDVFHQGLSRVTGITIGQANIVVGLLIIILDAVLGQDIGWGTILNMILIGTFIDILMLNNLIPTFNNFFPSLIMLVLGIVVEGYGCWIYLLAQLGAGPRDGLMVILTKRTGKSVRFNKSMAELGAVIVGYFLGGSLGLGTVIMAFLGGPIFQWVFKTVNFNVKDVEHRFIQDDIKYLKEKFKIKKEN
jgi:uncharacterized membrane protein YczE